MDNSRKLEICKHCADRISAKFRFCNDISKDELVNEGYTNIRSDDDNQAFTQAYLYMLHFVHTNKIKKNADRERKRVILMLSMKEDCINMDEILDLKSAMSKLTVDELTVLYDYFYQCLDYREIAKKQGKSNPGSTYWQMSRVLNKLRDFLSR